jgi:drug/metabolite transporter (DMT)-like permease
LSDANSQTSSPPPTSQTTDHLGKALSCALGAACFLSVMNVVSKILVEYMNPLEVVFWRNIVSLALLVMLVVLYKRTDLFKTSRWKGHLLRSVIGTVGMALAVWMFKLLSLAEGVSVSFTAPLFVVLLSRPILKEHVGLPRITAAIVGFMGVLVIAQPWNSDTSLNFLGVMVGLAFASMNASVMMCLRWLGDTENAITTVFYFLLIGLVGTALIMPFFATPIPQSDCWIVAVLGIVGLISLVLKTESYRWGKAALVAPLSYSLLLWAMLFDYLVWDVKPGWNVVLGAVIIIGSNAFIIYREHLLKKRSSAKQII